jgi:hypothetical protein
VCNYCHDIVKIDRREILLALTRHQVLAEANAAALEKSSQ